MIQLTYLGTPVFLLPYQPHWSGAGVSATFDKITYRDVGLSAREEREVLAEKLRATLSYETLLDTDEAAALRVALRNWNNRPILCPFWPAETVVGDGMLPSVDGALRVWYEPDWSAWEVGAGASPAFFTPSAECRTAPVLWGRFDEFPQPKTVTGTGWQHVQFKLVENGIAANALAPREVPLKLGQSVNGVDVPKLGIPVNWGQNSETIDVRIKRSKIGNGREDVDAYYAHTARERHKLDFKVLNTAETSYLLNLFQDREGSRSPWWCPSAYSKTEYIYGRFFGDSLSLVWTKPARSGELAEADVEFLSLPAELNIPAGEDFGDTIGPIAARWFGYVVTDGTTTWRYTGYESDIAGPGGTYQHQAIKHGRITKEINLQVNDCTLELNHWSGNPFVRLLQRANAAKLKVTIYEGLISNPGGALPIYTGTAMAPRTVGSKMTIKLKGPSALLSVKGPRSGLQITCLAVLGDSRCKVNIAALRATPSLLSFADGVAEFDVSGAGWAAHFFQYGYAERIVDGVKQVFPISDSYTADSGKLACSLVGNVWPEPVGTETGWTLTPGCDGTMKTCKAKFNNLVNMRAAPHAPNDNPAMVAIAQNSSGGKK